MADLSQGGHHSSAWPPAQCCHRGRPAAAANWPDSAAGQLPGSLLGRHGSAGVPCQRWRMASAAFDGAGAGSRIPNPGQCSPESATSSTLCAEAWQWLHDMSSNVNTSNACGHFFCSIPFLLSAALGTTQFAQILSLNLLCRSCIRCRQTCQRPRFCRFWHGRTLLIRLRDWVQLAQPTGAAGAASGWPSTPCTLSHSCTAKRIRLAQAGEACLGGPGMKHRSLSLPLSLTYTHCGLCCAPCYGP